MNLSNWIRFRWDLTQLPKFDVELPEHYEIGSVTAEDETELRKVISSSFVLDPAWNPATQEVMETIALRHGLRIIGAAVVSQNPEAEIHLSPGPCVSTEYRNRGFGTRLLEQSLTKLREAGLKEAVGIAHENAPVTKFLYPKFNGTPSPYDPAPVLAT
jgi:ribosomal protein S18 acetylase RimI-like enzyme